MPCDPPISRAKTVPYFMQQKQQGIPLCLVTCYDYPSAQLIAETDIDAVLVGDSVAMVVHGHKTTVTATLSMMALHTRAVANGIGNQLIITDLPFLSYRQSLAKTVAACQKLMQAGAQAVKLEGGDADVIATIRHLVLSGIPVVGHIGLTPQFIHQFGGYRVQGKETDQAEALLQQAYHLAEAGCFCLVIECVPTAVAQTIQQHITIPTIGIGAGIHCDGQIMVWHDILGLQSQFKPKFVKQYVQAADLMRQGLVDFCDEVRMQHFPNASYSYE